MRIEQLSSYPALRDTWPVQDTGASRDAGTTTTSPTGSTAPVDRKLAPVAPEGASNDATVDLTAVLDLHIRVQVSGNASNAGGHGVGRLNHHTKRLERIVDHAMRDLFKAADAAGVSRSDLEAALKDFRGSVDQALKDFRDNKDGQAFVDAVKGAVTALGTAVGKLFTTGDANGSSTTNTPATTDTPTTTTTPATTGTTTTTTPATTDASGTNATTATTAVETTGNTGSTGVPVLSSKGSLFAGPGANGLAALFDRLLRAVEKWASDTRTHGAHGHRHDHENNHDEDDTATGVTAGSTTTTSPATNTTGSTTPSTTTPATTTPATTPTTSTTGTTTSFEFTFALYASFRYTQTTATGSQVSTTA